MDKDFVRSPCMSICALDDKNVCVGCFRTSNEIKGWSNFSSEEKKAVIAETKIRFEGSTKHFLV